MGDGMELISDAFERHKSVFEKTKNTIFSDVLKAAEVLREAALSGKKVLICGNGGSAADAQHFAGEWLCKYKNDRQPLAAIALTADISAVTAIANDYGFEYVFSRQVEALGEDGDVLVAITTSGKSPNVLGAIETAREKSMKIVTLTGARGAELAKKSDVIVIIPSKETARIQEMHECVIHAWCEYVDVALVLAK